MGNNDVFVTLNHLRLTGDSILIQTEFRGHFASCCAVMIKHNIAWSSMEIRNSACCGELSNVKKQSRESDAADEMNQSWCKELWQWKCILFWFDVWRNGDAGHVWWLSMVCDEIFNGTIWPRCWKRTHGIRHARNQSLYSNLRYPLATSIILQSSLRPQINIAGYCQIFNIMSKYLDFVCI